MTLHQVYCGTDEPAEELLIRLEQGSLYPPIDAVLDARSVTDAVAASDCTTPQEASLKLHLLAIRDRLARGLLRSVSWCDTRDMLGDGLTKGGIDRKLLQDAMAGFINMKHEVKTKGDRSLGTNAIQSWLFVMHRLHMCQMVTSAFLRRKIGRQ